jgi:hypothetical protein
MPAMFRDKKKVDGFVHTMREMMLSTLHEDWFVLLFSIS